MKTLVQQKNEVWRNFQVKLFATEAKRVDDFFARNHGMKKSAILRAAILSYMDKEGA